MSRRPPAWRVGWWAFGVHEDWTDADVAWRQSVSLSPGTAPFQSLSVTNQTRHDLARLSGAFPWHAGRAVAIHGGQRVIAGKWDAASVQIGPRREDGSCELRFTMTDSAMDDLGEFPPVTEWRPERSEDETWAIVVPGDPGAQVFDPESWNKAYLSEEQRVEVRGGSSTTPANYPRNLARKDVFPNIPELSEGQRYPWPFGTAGKLSGDPDSEDSWVPAVPAYVFDESALAGADLGFILSSTPVNTSTVYLYGPQSFDSGTGERVVGFSDRSYTVSTNSDAAPGVRFAQTLDDEDRSTTAGTGPGSAVVIQDVTQPYFSAWPEAPNPGDAPGLLLTVLEYSTVRFDRASIERLRPILSRYEFAGYVSQPQAPMTWLTSSILPLLPVTLTRDRALTRLTLMPWHEDAPQYGGVQLTQGIGCTFADAGLGHLEADPPVSVTVDYAYRADNQTYARSVTLEMVDVLPDVKPTSDGITIRTEYVYQDDVALLVARDQLRARAWSGRTVEIQIDDFDRFGPDGLQRLEPGRPVRLTWDALGLSSAQAIVGEVEQTAEAMRIVAYIPTQTERPVTIAAAPTYLPPDVPTPEEDDVPTQGAYSAADSANGKIHLVNDGPIVRYYVGSTWIDKYTGYGSITRRTASEFSTFNFDASSTITDDADVGLPILFLNADGTSASQGATLTVDGASDFTATVAIEGLVPGSNSRIGAALLNSSGTGHWVEFLEPSGSTVDRLALIQRNSSGVYVSDTVSSYECDTVGPRLVMRFEYDSGSNGTTVKCDTSNNGSNMRVLGTISSFTPNRIAIGGFDPSHDIVIRIVDVTIDT